jgi:hypothetical protein
VYGLAPRCHFDAAAILLGPFLSFHNLAKVPNGYRVSRDPEIPLDESALRPDHQQVFIRKHDQLLTQQTMSINKAPM